MELDLRERMGRIIEPSIDRLRLRRELRDELLEIGVATVWPTLTALLTDPDGGFRCEAATLTLLLDAEEGMKFVLPLFRDPESWVRYAVVGLMDLFGRESGIDGLAEVLKYDPDPGVRGQAAHALGRIRSPKAIPALLGALDHDHEVDALGYTPSFIAAGALDNILGTNQTRIKVTDTLHKMAPWEPDLGELRSAARACYDHWRSSQ